MRGFGRSIVGLQGGGYKRREDVEGEAANGEAEERTEEIRKEKKKSGRRKAGRRGERIKNSDICRWG